MVRLDDEERREAAVFEKPGRILLARARKFRRERGMEIHRQLRKPDRKSENVLSRNRREHGQWRLSVGVASRSSSKRRCRYDSSGRIRERSNGHESRRECRRGRAERK